VLDPKQCDVLDPEIKRLTGGADAAPKRSVSR
jgi:hypothetical protein